MFFPFLCIYIYIYFKGFTFIAMFLFTVYFETYGCQMNVSDMEIVWAILKENGFERTMEIKEVSVDLHLSPQNCKNHFFSYL